MQLQALQPNSTKDAKSSIVVEMKLQITSQKGMVKACKAIIQTCLKDHNKLLAKSTSTKKAWNSTSKKLEMFKWQKGVLSTQVKSLRSDNQWLNFSPLPWPFVPMDIDVSL